MLTPVSGQTNVFDMSRADDPIEDGTPLNKATLLQDDTAALYDLGGDAVPDDMFRNIAQTFLNLYLIKITFDSTYVGKPFTVTNKEGTVYSGTVPLDLTKVVGLGAANTQYQINCEGAFRTVITGTYYGIQPVSIHPINPILSLNSWENIAKAAATGEAQKYWEIGDEKDIELSTGEILTAQIWGYSHDDLADESGKANITFGLKNLMDDKYEMNDPETNVGGWESSDMRSYMETILNTFPSDIKLLIKPVHKKSTIGNKSIQTQTTSDSLWIPSCVELDSNTTDDGYKDEGSPYQIFTNSQSRIKRLSNGSGATSQYWTRSPQTSTSTLFINVRTDGTIGSSGSDNLYGVCFGFCL